MKSRPRLEQLAIALAIADKRFVDSDYRVANAISALQEARAIKSEAREELRRVRRFFYIEVKNEGKTKR